MALFTRADRSALAAITAELDTLHLDGRSSIDTVLPAMASLVGVESMLVYATAVRGDGRVLKRWHTTMRNGDLLESLSRKAFAAEPIAPEPEPGLDLPRAVRTLLPAVAVPNRVIEGIEWIERSRPGTWRASAFCRDVFVPARIEDHRQYRALVCDGRSLLAWFGTITPNRLPARNQRLLQALVPAMQRRLSIERRLAAVPYLQAALDVALERLGVPAFVLDRRGRIRDMSSAARALFAERRRELVMALSDVVRGRAGALRFELSQLREPHGPAGWLAVLRIDRSDERIAANVAAATSAWALTRRQRDVLRFLARGLANATIADELGIGERAVTLHVTALLDRAGVDSRAALIAKLLTAG